MDSPRPLLSRLRDATSDAHRQLESTIDIGAAVSSVAGYEFILTRFLAFHAALEPRLQRLLQGEGFGYQPGDRLKSPWLVADLQALGRTPGEIASLPAVPPALLPPLELPAHGWGCAYVLEGSTLGGRHISAMLNAQPHIPVNARQFFHSYGAKTGERWKEFLHALECFGSSASPAGHEHATASACDTFRSLQLWMQSPHAHE